MITTVLIAPILTVLAPLPRPAGVVGAAPEEDPPEEDPHVRAARDVRLDLGVALGAAALGLLIGFAIERRVERHALARARAHAQDIR